MSSNFFLHLAWIPAAAALGFTITAVFAGRFHLERRVFLAVYLALVAPFLYAYTRWSHLSMAELVRHNWVWGLAGAAITSAFLVRNIRSQPSSPRSRGLPLVFDTLWLGLVYGALDAMFLSVLPVIAAWQAFSAPGWTASLPGRIAAAVFALLASLFVTAAYHLGYPEYRGQARVMAPSIGNTVMSLGYILTANPITAVFSHIAMHIAGVFQGPDTVVQLPPHYK